MSYTGKYLHINLTTQKHYIGETDRNLTDLYIGGKGLGFALLEKLAPNPDALGPENPLIFVNGPFTGTKVQTSARTALVTKSPLTNSALDSHVGGNFGPAIKRSGYDYIIINGKSKTPCYLYIFNNTVEFKDATDIWGKGIFETNDILIGRHTEVNPRVAAIGQAGENLSFIACIGVDKHRNYGRGGSGAVMGSKNLKAIVVDGNNEIHYTNENEFKDINLKYTREITNNEGVKFRRIKGTMKCVRSGQQYEYLPTKNHQLVQFDDFEKISSEAAREELNWEDTSCFNCAIRCSKWARWDGHEIEGPEYETAAFLGSGSMVNSIKDISWANEICNDLGMDTISAGITCSFAMECYEKGVVTDWQGLKLEWGNAPEQRRLLEMMAYRKGIGALFTDGTKVAAKTIGKGSEDWAINTYGMELSGINPKGSLTMGVMFAVADFASHTRLWIAEQELGPQFTIDDIPQTLAEGLDTVNARNSMIICDFVPLSLDKLAEILNAATGSSHDANSLLKAGSRITNLARSYNIRNGRTNLDDTLPGRFFNEESLAGFMRGKKLSRSSFNEIVEKYYQLRGWNKQGIPAISVV